MLDLTFATALALFLASALRSATPLVITAIGGSFGAQANVFNVGLESMMITGSFVGFWVSHETGDVWFGLLAGGLGGTMVSFILAFVIIDLGADEVVAGIALNIGALGLSAVLLKALFGSDGAFKSTTAGLVERFDPGFLADVPFLGTLIAGLDPVIISAIVLVGLAQIFTTRTTYGLRLRAIGSHEEAVRSTGVGTRKYKYGTFLISGLLAGISGAYLPLSGLSLFAVNMTAGMGFVALAAVIFGAGMPVRVAVAAYLFGAATGAAYRLQDLGLPTQVVLMLPYIVTLVALVWKSVVTQRKQGRPTLQQKEQLL